VESEPAVVHCGVRHGQDVQRVVGGYIRGLGTMAMKHIRSGDAYALRSFLREGARHGREGTRQMLRGRRPVSYRALLTLLHGAASSFRYEIDAQRRLYRRHGSRAISTARPTARL